MPLTMLKSETGQNPAEVVEQIEVSRVISPDVDDDARLGEYGFQLYGTVPFSSLICYKVCELENGKCELIELDTNSDGCVAQHGQSTSHRRLIIDIS